MIGYQLEATEEGNRREDGDVRNNCRRQSILRIQAANLKAFCRKEIESAEMSGGTWNERRQGAEGSGVKSAEHSGRSGEYRANQDEGSELK